MKPVELPLLSELFYPAFKAALPLRILSRPPTGIGWWSDFWVFCPASISFAQKTDAARITVGAVLYAALGCVSFPTQGPPAGRPLRVHSSNHTVGAVINRPHWWMTCAPDKNGTLYLRAIDHRPYRKTPLLGTNIIPYPLSIIHYPTAYASGG